MASITINPVKPSVSIPSDITGKEKIIAIDSNGRPATITINLIIDRMDDQVVDRIDDEILEKVENQIEDLVDERLDNIDTNTNLNWNEVYD